MTRRPELDGIRAFAVLAVLAFHAGVRPATGGWLGVDIFFVLSGYLITFLLLRERERTGTNDMRAFWVRRLLRLYPGLLVALVLGAFFFSTLGDHGTFLGYLRTAGAAGTYVENFVWSLGGTEYGRFGHTWSLAVEMQFYLVWPVALIALLKGGRRLLPWIAGAITISFLLYILESTPEVGRFSASYYLPWTRAFELLAGALVAVLISQRPTEPASDALPSGRRWIGWLLGFGFAVVLIAAWTDSIYVRQRAILWESAAITVLTVALLLHLEKVRGTGVGALLGWAPVAWLGEISYGIYLFHYPVIQVLRHQAGISTSRPMLMAALPITIAIAAASYYLVERPASRRSRRFTGPSSRAGAQPIV